MTTRKPDWWLERVALGEVPGVDRQSLDPDSRQRLEDLERSNQEILERYPPAGVRIEVERRLRRATASRGGGRRWVWGLIPAAAAAALMAMPSMNDSEERGTERIKGESWLIVHRQRDRGVEQLDAEDRLAKGDLIQLSYAPGGQGYGAVLSVDGRGVVTLHLPQRPFEAPFELQPHGASLPAGYELDDAPGFERFFYVVCPHRFSVSEVVASADSLPVSDAAEASLPVDEGCRVDSLLLRKVEP